MNQKGAKMNYALGLKNMLYVAILEHVRNDHAGRRPKRIELHHAVYQELLREMAMHECTFINSNDRWPRFCGVEIREVSERVPPRMVTADNVIQEL